MGVEITTDEMDQTQFDPFRVEGKKPGYKYRLLNNNERNIAAKLRKGYEIVRDSDPEKLTLTDSTPMKKGADLDTTQRFNDVILARIPEEKIAKFSALNRELINRRAAMVNRQYKGEDSEHRFDATSGSGGSTIYGGQMTEAQFSKVSGKGK